MSHLKQFQEKLVAAGHDAALVTEPANQRYLTDFPFEDGLVLVTPKKGYLLTDFRYEEAARDRAAKDFEVIIPDHGMLVKVTELLASEGCRQVAIEDASLSLATFRRYEERLSDFTLTDGASAILDELRLYKDEAELDTIGRAQAITDAAFAHILEVLHPNMTEIEVALELEFFMRRRGADGLAFETIAVSGSNSSRPHGVPRNCKLEKGFLTMDFGARLDGYCSDMTRTVVLGRADDEMKKVYSTVLAAQRAALEVAAEGFSCRELDRVARDLIYGAGYEGCFGHSLGHGVGLFVHENPRLSSAAAPDEVLKRGHVITFEPGIYLSGKYGCRIEDMVAVRHDGTLYDYTKSPKELIELF